MTHITPPPFPPQPPMPIAYAPLGYASYDQQRANDDSHLNLLVIFHYIWAGLLALLAFFPIIYVVLGVMIARGTFTSSNRQNEMPPEVGYIFIGIGVLACLFGWTLALLNFLSARGMRQRKWRMLSLILAGVNCLSVPLGTTLGVFTFVVLLRASVAWQYAEAARQRQVAAETPPP